MSVSSEEAFITAYQQKTIHYFKEMIYYQELMSTLSQGQSSGMDQERAER